MLRRKKKQRTTHQYARIQTVVGRASLVAALAAAEYDRNEEAAAAARRLLKAVDDSPYDYLAVA